MNTLPSDSSPEAASTGPTPAEVEKLQVLLSSPEARAILAAAEQKAIELISSLPSRRQVTLDAVTGKPVITPGWQTSEFWTLIVFLLLSILTVASGFLPAHYAAIADAIVSGLYQVSRGLAKRGTGI